MQTLLLLSTISLAAATTNKGLGYLQCATSIARTYHNTECTSPSALDCFCNAPFNPDTLDQDTLDSCASEGVAPTSIPQYICSDTTVPVPARKGSTPMMRVASPNGASSNESVSSGSNPDSNSSSDSDSNDKDKDKDKESATKKSNLRTAPDANIMDMDADEMRDMDMDMVMKRAYAPSPDTDTTTEDGTEEDTDTNAPSTTTTPPEHHGVHMTDASNANVVYKLYTETRTDCACDLPGYTGSSPSSTGAVGGVGVEGVNSPATQTGVSAATATRTVTGGATGGGTTTGSTGVVVVGVDGVMATSTAITSPSTSSAAKSGDMVGTDTDGEEEEASSAGVLGTPSPTSNAAVTGTPVGGLNGTGAGKEGGSGDHGDGEFYPTDNEDDDDGVMFTGGAGAGVVGRGEMVGVMVVAGLVGGWIIA
ncbi:hypothetical protein BO78DRAFT_390437 [Aspergillus sclerotiicarbonarius CBS 121057]|uniref:Extracellular membrane protein CFEM domain-containing protein n=1 Tax=Aspergillus sclerotiicarbonarius (strain CBS 121057 / IBT 28362) TaxID=1448318 RepID=A0A319F940_ASPSB|nr:hypothetical protein BO78DRAFT_390437 [Aspergillus sclerotiicarbonarius CBS 121057]